MIHTIHVTRNVTQNEEQKRAYAILMNVGSGFHCLHGNLFSQQRIGFPLPSLLPAAAPLWPPLHQPNPFSWPQSP